MMMSTPRKQKYKDPKSQSAPNGEERLKTVVRRLPPNLPEEIFWQSVQAWVSDDTVTWKSYHPGKLRTKRVNKEGIPSRAYIAFKSEALVATFSRAYEGHLFRDKAGNESHAVVEYAPFQKIPAEKKKADARNNTIDDDDDYLSFLETLKGTAKTESVSLEALIAASQPPPPPTTTPLLEALKAEKSAQKDKDAILRNHAHYKDMTPSGSSKKEDAKKKAPAAAQQTTNLKPESPAQATSKKARKMAAAQKVTVAQEGQGAATTKGVGVATPTNTSPSAATSSGKTSTPLPTRHRPSHGRSHAGKGEVAPTPASVSASAPVPMATSGPTPNSEAVPGLGPPAATTTDNVPPTSPGQGQRKNRPVIGLGRHFEAALNGAGVGVSPGDRKRRDKGAESGAGAGADAASAVEGAGGGKPGKHRHHHHHHHREERVHPPPHEISPGVLQRPAEAGQGSTEVVIMQRPSTEGQGEGGAGAGVGVGAEATPNPGLDGRGRGGARRGRGRGRVHRGG